MVRDEEQQMSEKLATISFLHQPTRHENIEHVVDNAIHAFWASVVKDLPEVIGGDFDPMAHYLMTTCATECVEHWLDANGDRSE